MSQDKICRCCTCGYEFPRYTDGKHSCTERLKKFVNVSHSSDDEPIWVPLDELLDFEFELLAPNGALLYRATVRAAYFVAKMHNGKNRQSFQLEKGALLRAAMGTHER